MDDGVDSIRDIMGLLRIRDYGLDHDKVVRFALGALRHASRHGEVSAFLEYGSFPKMMSGLQLADPTYEQATEASYFVFEKMRNEFDLGPTYLDENENLVAQFHRVFPEWLRIPMAEHLKTVADAIAALVPDWVVPSEPIGLEPLSEEDDLEEDEEMGYGSWKVETSSPDGAMAYLGEADYPVGAMLDMLRDIRENLWLSDEAYDLVEDEEEGNDATTSEGDGGDS